MLNQLHPSLGPIPGTFSRPTLRLEDAFYFDPNLSVHGLTEMVWRLSEEYLQGSPFFIQLKTSDGDTYLSLKFRDLPYFFNRRRERLWRLDLYGGSLDGQQISLQLWFHPLSKEPNAKVGILAHRAEEISTFIQTTIGVAPPAHSEPNCLHQAYQITPDEFDIQSLVKEIRSIADFQLLSIPPIGCIWLASGVSYKGLSLYQLQRDFLTHREQIRALSISVCRLVTNQCLSLSLSWKENASLSAYLSFMWGDSVIQQRISRQFQYKLGWKKNPAASRELQEKSSEIQTWGIDLGENQNSNSLEPSMKQLFDSKRKQCISVEMTQAHKVWQERLSLLQQADGWIVDLSHPTPTQWYYLGMSRLLGKQLLFISQTIPALPESYQKIPMFIYSPTEDGIQGLMEELSDII